ncbi:MAG TPA: MFS transporter [Thermoguttaceae bacterium]|nr:MFS transporter [Thermoguttaceae bacterium]
MTDVANSSETNSKVPVIPGEVFLPFCLVTTLFALWGFANDVTNPLVRAFQEVFLISSAQSGLVQTAFYGGYATMAIPAAIFIRRFSYKAGILVGLALYATGALLFIPASMMMQFWIFLVALYILTFGLAFLETTANPYVLAMGPAATATRRLNFAQAFNPIGSLVGMVVASQIVLASLGVTEFRGAQKDAITAQHKAQYEANVAQYKADPAAYEASLEEQEKQLTTQKDTLDDYDTQLENFKDRQMAVLGEYKPMMPGRLDGKVRAALVSYAAGETDFDVKDAEGNKKYADHQAMQSHDLNVIRLPYVVIGMVIIAALIVFATAKLPKAGGDDPQLHLIETVGNLLRNGRYLGGVVAQTFYVAAQIMCWTFIIHYAMINLNMSLSQAQQYNIVAMAIFCSSRFVCTYLLKFVSPGGLLMSLAVGGFALTAGTMFIPGMTGLYCLIGISACMSLMFPTIYGLALDGLGDDAKLGSAGLIFAIVGGALTPPLQGRIIDLGDDITGMLDVGFTTMPAVSASFVLPLICFAVIAIYGYMTHNSRPQPEPAA